MIRFVDEHQDRFGVQPIISVLRATDAGFLSVSGYRKMHDALRRAGVELGRDHLARLMRQLGPQGCAPR